MGLCDVIDRSRTSIYRWGDENSDVYEPEFSDILEKLNTKQQKVLLNNGINGKFNSNITKLVLGKHGFHDKVDTDQTTKLVVSIGDKDAGTL